MAIGLFPAWFATPQPDWPSQFRIAGFPMFDGQTGRNLDPDVLEFCQADTPPIVLTFGTGMMHAAELFRQAVEACDRIRSRAILLTKHPDQLPIALPPSVRHFEFVSLKQLLPHCAAIVHHGGIGTVAKALATGTPQLIIPHAWDQLDNAKRVEQLGAGKWLKRRRATAKRIATALAPVMSDESHTRCLEITSRSEDEGAMLRVAQWIEELG